MIIPDIIRRLADARDNDVITADNDLELLTKLYQRFEDVKRCSNHVRFKGHGPIFGAMPMFGSGGVSMMADMDSVDYAAPCEDEDVLELESELEPEPEQSVPTTDEGFYMFLRKLQEEIAVYEHEHGTKSALASVKNALADRLSKEPGRDVQPSRLVVPRYGDIMLEDFGCGLNLRPLPRAVLVLFLRHPEGIVLKDRKNYFEELKGIYGLVCRKENNNKIAEHCERLLDVADGSMDEKITIVNSIFKKNLTVALAEKYQILGKRGGVKSIRLDRSLVELPEEFDSVPWTVLKM